MRNKTLTIAFVALLGLGSVSCAKLQARDNLNKGVRAFRDAKYEAAINYFQKAVELDPSLSMAEVYLATAYQQQYIPGAPSPDNQKNADKARAQVRDSLLQIAPRFAKQKYMLGDEYSMLDVSITPLLWRLDYYGIQMPKQAAPLLKYAERLFARPAFSEALTSAERGMRK